MPKMLSTAFELLGAGLVTAGAAMLSIPAAFVIAGAFVFVIGYVNG